jgi:Kef-type K+ transport system membrane component KefB
VTLAALAVAATATQLAGLHLVIGALLFGATVPARPREAALRLLARRPLTLLGAALLPLAFALPALRVDVWALRGNGLVLLAVVLAVVAATKLGAATLAAAVAGLPRAAALVAGALMNARGLVELVVLAVGLDRGLIDARLFTVMVLMALATTFATGPLVDRLERGRVGAARRGPTRRVRAGAPRAAPARSAGTPRS